VPSGGDAIRTDLLDGCAETTRCRVQRYGTSVLLSRTVNTVSAVDRARAGWCVRRWNGGAESGSRNERESETTALRADTISGRERVLFVMCQSQKPKGRFRGPCLFPV
jgi:hypothetical protein